MKNEEEIFGNFQKVYHSSSEFNPKDYPDKLNDGSFIVLPLMMNKSYALRKNKWFKGFRGPDYNKIVNFTDKDYDLLNDINLDTYFKHLNKTYDKLNYLESNYKVFQNILLIKLDRLLGEAHKLERNLKFSTNTVGKKIKKIPGFFFDGEKHVNQYHLTVNNPQLLLKLFKLIPEALIFKGFKILEPHKNEDDFDDTFEEDEDVSKFTYPDIHKKTSFLRRLSNKVQKTHDQYYKNYPDAVYEKDLGASDKKIYEIIDAFDFSGMSIDSFEYFTFKIRYHKIECENLIRRIELIKRRRIKKKRQSVSKGHIYFMSNKAYPNIYKIGSTFGLPEERAEELTGTGHLYPFKVEFSIEIENAEYYEKSLHKILSKFRVNKNREFFDIELKKLKDISIQLSAIVKNHGSEIKLSKLKALLNII